jgi:hypothetical protein
VYHAGMSEVTEILEQIGPGDPRAAEQLLPYVYDELRKLAGIWSVTEKSTQPHCLANGTLIWM